MQIEYNFILDKIPDLPYDPIYFAHPARDVKLGLEYLFPYDNFPINSVYHTGWLNQLKGIKFIIYWAQLPINWEIVLSEKCISSLQNDPDCYLLIINLHEARFDNIDKLSDQIYKTEIPFNKVIMLTSDIEIDGKTINNLKQVWVDNYWEALCKKHHKTLTNTSIVHPDQYTLKHVDRKFLSLNRNIKIHRMQWMYAMRNENFDITPQGHVSFHLPAWQDSMPDHYQHVMNNWRHPHSGIPDQNFETMTLDPLHPLTDSTISNSNALTEFYQRSYFSVVTESDDKLPFVTEKTFKTIACMHPFMIVGNKKMHEQLRNKGYHTFEEYFERDGVETQEEMIEFCEWINSKDMEFFQKKTEKVLDKLTDNFYNYISGSVDWNNIVRKVIGSL